MRNCVHLLGNNAKDEEIICYPVSNNGVIYNINTKQQTFLSLHTNIITSLIISSDKELIILGDSGASKHPSVISLWNSSTYELIAQYQLPRNFGVESLEINSESNLLAAIINESIPSINKKKDEIVQHLSLWSLTESQSEENQDCIDLNLLSQQKMKHSNNDQKGLYHFICFNDTSTEIVTHGESVNNFIFWSIAFEQKEENEEEVDLKLKPHNIQISDNANNIDLSAIGNLTSSVFFPASHSPLISATDCGDLIVWDYEEKKSNDEDSEVADAEHDDPDTKQRAISKIITKITRGAINCVSILANNKIIALASSSGSVRFFDFEFRVIGWLDYLGDAVTSVSFPLDIPKYKDFDSVDNEFVFPPMIIGTKNNKIIKVTSPSSSDGGDTDSDPMHSVIIDTFNTVCSAMSAHPSLPLLAVGNKNGEIQLWDMMNKSILQTIALSQPQQIRVIVI